MIENARLSPCFLALRRMRAVAIFVYGKYKHTLAPVRDPHGDLDAIPPPTRSELGAVYCARTMHPEYPCAHCTFQSTAASALEAFFGNDAATFRLTSTSAPGVTRSFNKLSDYVAEVVNARVYDGVHYRTSGEAGAVMGRKIGQYTVQNFLKPLR